jgi:hypothetical protein
VANEEGVEVAGGGEGRRGIFPRPKQLDSEAVACGNGLGEAVS